MILSSQLHRYIIPAPLCDGQLRIQHTTVTSVPASGGASFHALLAIQDVTDLTHRIQQNRETRDQALEEAGERRRAEETLRRYAVELEARNNDPDAFAHTVAHDLKNPLHIITGYAGILCETLTSVSSEEAIESLRSPASNCAWRPASVSPDSIPSACAQQQELAWDLGNNARRGCGALRLAVIRW